MMMGGPDMAPHTPPRSGRPGEAGVPLGVAGVPLGVAGRVAMACSR